MRQSPDVRRVAGVRFWRKAVPGRGSNRPVPAARSFGGGSTLIAAARLGADVVDGDVDPLVVDMISAKLKAPEEEPLRKAGAVKKIDGMIEPRH